MFEKIYIINLENQADRRSKIKEQLESAGFYNYEFINAISGSNLQNTEELVKSNILSNTFIDPNGLLTKNIIACSLSHQLAHKKMIDDGHDTCLILEDDIKINPLFFKFIINGNIAEIRSEMKGVDWDIFMWGLVGENIPHYNVESNFKYVREYKKFSPDWAAHAYEITRKGALKLIENNTPVKFAADVNLETSNCKIYCTPWSLINQDAELMSRFDTENLEVMLKNILWSSSGVSSTNNILHIGGSLCGTPMYDIYFSPDRNIKFERKKYSLDICKQIDFKTIEFKTYTDSFGFTNANWCYINF